MSAEELLQRLFQVTVAMSDAMEEDLASRGLTRARATVLAYLYAQGPSIQSTLAQALRVTPRNVTGLVTGLEAGGLVERVPHPTDGRALVVQLTDAGARAAAALAYDEQELARYLFAHHTPAERDDLAAGFDRMLERLEHADFDTLRRAARQRWPLPARARRTRQNPGDRVSDD